MKSPNPPKSPSALGCTETGRGSEDGKTSTTGHCTGRTETKVAR
jgi:hypothetical protein